MTYCDICTNTYSPADFLGCPHCALAEGRAPELAGRVAEPAVTAMAGAIGELMAERTLQEPPPAPPDPSPHPQAPEGLNEGIRKVLDQRSAVAAPEAAPGADLPPWLEAPSFEATGPAEAEPARGSIGGHVVKELDVEALRKLRESGVFIMVLLGFPTAGKTWFLNRLKYELQEGDAYACYPKRAPPGEVENTLLFTAHRFRKGASDFYVIDIPGERFQKAVEDSFLGEPHALMRHVIFSGHAFLTILPADETLLSERAHDARWRQQAAEAAGDPPDTLSGQALIDRVDALKKRILQARKAAGGGDAKARARIKTLLAERRRLVEASVQGAIERLAAKNEELGDYISGIGLMSQLMVVMEEKGSPDLDPHMDGYEVFDCSRRAERKKPMKPMFVVLSKSDEMTHRSDAVQAPIRRLARGNRKALAELQTLIQEPARADAFAALTALRPGVARQIDEWFALTSFQFATAFSGVSRGSKEINYRLKHVGVTELIRAILKLKEHTDKRRPLDSMSGWFRRKPAPEPARTPEPTP